MRIRLTLSAGLVACALAGAAPALLDDPASPEDGTPVARLVDEQAAGRVSAEADETSSGRRDLHPRHTSGGEPGTIAAPLPAGRRAAIETGRVGWQVAPGVRYTRWSQVDARGPITAHLLTIKPRTPGLQIDYASIGAVRRVAPVADILARDRAIAGVNGDFYDIGRTGAPLGVGRDRQLGLLHGREDGWNNAFFIGRDGRADIGNLPVHAAIRHHPELEITNLNSPYVSPGGIGIYNQRWGRSAGYSTTQGQKKRVRQVTVVDGVVTANSPRLSNDKAFDGVMLVGRGDSAARLRSLKVGSRVKVSWWLEGRPQMAITGNHFLVHEGIIRAVDDSALHPRTAVGVDDDTGEVLLLVIDGRQDDSRGYTMVELADLMIDLGADEAVNLDGGGSSTMVGRNRVGKVRVLNDPSDGFQRWVANAIEVTYRKP